MTSVVRFTCWCTGHTDMLTCAPHTEHALYTRLFLHTQRVRTHACTHTYTHMRADTHTRAHIDTHTHAHVHTHSQIHYQSTNNFYIMSSFLCIVVSCHHCSSRGITLPPVVCVPQYMCTWVQVQHIRTDHCTVCCSHPHVCI